MSDEKKTTLWLSPNGKQSGKQTVAILSAIESVFPDGTIVVATVDEWEKYKNRTAQLKIAREALKTIKSNRMNPDGPAWGAMMIAEEALSEMDELDEKPGR